MHFGAPVRQFRLFDCPLFLAATAALGQSTGPLRVNIGSSRRQADAATTGHATCYFGLAFAVIRDEGDGVARISSEICR
jgi:hypothetical protein